MKMGWLSKVPLWISPRMMSWAVLAFFTIALLTILFPAKPWPVRSAIFPTGIVLLALVLSVFEIAIAKIAHLNARFAPHKVLDLGLPDDVDKTQVVEKSNGAVLWLVSLVVGFAIIGFQATVIIFTCAYLRVMARASWRATLLYTAATWVLIFVVFEAMISIPWPKPLILSLFYR